MAFAPLARLSFRRWQTWPQIVFDKPESPFTFQPMSANERRIIHLTLADSTDLFTESIGEGSDRKLRIGPKSSARKDS